MRNNCNYIIILLFLFHTIFCSESSEIFNSLANYNMICSNKSEGCSFNVTNNYPISPKIPTEIPTHAILGEYRYIYLKFTIPKKQKQKTFYLEAYYTLNEETIISNGNCYHINTNNNVDYEIRIYKKLKENNYIRFGFFGIPSNFTMLVELQFELNIHLYFNDIALTGSNSLYKENITLLSEYLEEKEAKIIDQKKREKLSKETLAIIVKKLFDVSIDVNDFEDTDSFFNSMIMPAGPYFFLTISYSVGLELSSQNIFYPENNILSETIFRDGKIQSHKDGFDFIDKGIYISRDIYKIMEFFNKKITDLASNLPINTDFTLILSTNDENDYIINSFRFYLENTQLINFEFQIKVQFNNQKLKELATLPVKQYAYIPYKGIDNPKISNLSLKEKKIKYLLSGIFYAIGISNLIKYDSTAIITVPILLKGIDFAEVGGTFLDMEKDENGIYHAIFDCWQQYFGYTNFYDFVFDTFTDMKKNNDGMFNYNNENYILWAWKGDYINLGAGAELGIYKGGRTKDSYLDFWRVDKSLALPMTLTLKHKIHGTIVDNWDNRGKDSWWITAFNPNYTKVKADDLTAYYTVKFKNKGMFDKFAEIEREGWTYDKIKMIAYLVL